ncbi:MAG TPA: hypothetical protein VK213_04475 [Bacteroidales bacterium]|nr:hypothetical protein [Bacteroidales bacterium]
MAILFTGDTAIARTTPVSRRAVDQYLTLNIFLPDLLETAVSPATARRYITNPDISGAATLIHGYDALDGFGITLNKNHIVEMMPSKKNMILGGIW